MKTNEILPKKGVGDVVFESDVLALQTLGYVEEIASFDEILNWHTYTKNEGLECYVKDNVVVCIACFANCHFQGVDLIGKTPEEVISIFGDPDEIGADVFMGEKTQQTPYEYFSYGLQIWMEAGRVVSVFCNSQY